MKRLIHAAVLVVGLGVGRTAMAQSVPQNAPTGLDFSVLMFGSYSVHTDSASKASLGGKDPNQFSLDRVYLTFRMPAGDNGQIRITTDIYQNLVAPGNAYYQGWAIRLKYGYFQYTGLQNAFGSGSSLAGRGGLVHDVAIDQYESAWPRYLQPPALERNMLFASSDLGVAGLLTLPNKWGEFYGSVVNGTGYTAPERDRFKDFGLRATFYPFAQSRSASPMIKSFAIVPWFYKGFVGSAFESGGAGQIGPGLNGAITDAMPRDRYGAYAAVKSHRLTASLDFAERVDASESGLNTTVSPRTETDSTGRLIDGFVIVRPLEWLEGSKPSAISVIARYDHVTPNVSPSSPTYVGTTPAYGFAIFGASYDLTPHITVALDWQGQSPIGFPPAVGLNMRPTPRQSTFFAHWNATF